MCNECLFCAVNALIHIYSSVMNSTCLMYMYRDLWNLVLKMHCTYFHVSTVIFLFYLWRVCVRARMCYWMYSKNWKLDSMLQNVTAHLTLNSQRYKKSSFLIEAMGVEEEVGLGKTSIKCILIQSNTNTASSISKNICFS